MDHIDDSNIIPSESGNREITTLEKIYQQYFDMLYEYGLRIHYDKEFTKDCIHDLFLRLWNNKNIAGSLIDSKAYLIVSYRNLVYNRLKELRRKKIISLTGNEDFELVFSAESDLIKKESATIRSNEIATALNKLSARQKEIIYLRFYQEIDYPEIGKIMNISVKAAYKLSARALQTLREILNISLSTLLFFLVNYKPGPFGMI